MKSKEEKQKVYWTLSLPVIELDNNEVYNSYNYNESGCAFVRLKDGGVYVVDIDKENGNVCHGPLPLNVTNDLIEQAGAVSVRTQVDERIDRLEEMICHSNDVTRSLRDYLTKFAESSLTTIYKEMKEGNESLEHFKNQIANFLNKKEKDEHTTAGIGFISQEALVEIIRTIK